MLQQSPSQITNSSKSSCEESLFELAGSTACNTSNGDSTAVSSRIASFNNSDNEEDKTAPLEIVIKRPEQTSSHLPDAKRTPTMTTLPTTSSKYTSSQLDPFKPKWSDTSDFVCPAEREGAINEHKKGISAQELCFPDFFRFGIRFRPGPNHSGISRTFVIDNLPPAITMTSLLSQVRGGMILDAKLLNTTSIDRSLTALITFVSDYGARDFIEHIQAHPIRFGDTKARTKLLPTPTYPMSSNLRISTEKYAHTRCLEIRNFPSAIKPRELENDLRVCSSMTINQIESKTYRSNREVQLRFTSIRYAGQAYGLLSTFHKYRQCKVAFVPDPCDRLPMPPSNKNGNMSRQAVRNCHDQVSANIDSVAASKVMSWREFAHPSPLQSSSNPQEDTIDSEKTSERLDQPVFQNSPVVQQGRGFADQVPANEHDSCSQQ